MGRLLRGIGMISQSPSYYEFVPLPDRAPLKFPGGAHVALIFTINIEYWEPFRPGQKAPLVCRRPRDHPARTAGRRARHGELDLARVRTTNRDLASDRRVRRDGRGSILHLQRHDPQRAPAHHRRGEGARLGAGAAQLGAERPADRLRATIPSKSGPSSAAPSTNTRE